ncbi:hypothetical protein FACS1894170_06640 [Planctomycetales bacterium]|nr:hypothetical protein FACS1894170_06640 [Planctomycetales bacterium]
MIHFKCTSCQYECSAPDDEVGNVMMCPSCYTKQRILPPNTNEEIETAEKSEAIYETHHSGIIKEYKADVPVYCLLCHTLMYAEKSHIGTELTCPDCGTKTIVR